MKADNIKVTIIIPVYNSEKYLRDCLNSVVNQDHKNIEIICVDDGSTDQSESIIREFSDKDDRLLLISKTNGGVSEARNAGLAVASGDFIVFVDSDDWIDRNLVSKALETSILYSADLVQYGIVKEYNKKSIFETDNSEIQIFAGSSINKAKIRFVGLTGNELSHPEKLENWSPVCKYLYRRDYIGDNLFRDIKRIGTGEDLLFNVSCSHRLSKLVCLPNPLYHYRRTSAESTVNKYKNDLFEKWQFLFQELHETIENGDAFELALNNRKALSLISLGINEVKSEESFIAQKRRIGEIASSDFYMDSIKTLDISKLSLKWYVFFMSIRTRCFGITTLLLRVMRLMIVYRSKR